MGKIAVVTDTNSGLTPEQGREIGVYVIPMPFYVDEKEYLESVEMTVSEFYQREKEGASVSTSQASPASILEMWDELLKEYDEIVHIPMSQALSASYATAMMLSNDYEGKVFVVDNKRISVTQLESVRDAVKLARQGKSGSEIRDILEADAMNSSIYIMLDTLSYLKKGGRITPAAAAIGSLLRIKPVLQIQGEKLDAFAKARTVNAGKTTMINAIKKDIEERFGGDIDGVTMMMAHSDSHAEIEVFKNEAIDALGCKEIDVWELPASIGVHIGPGSIAIAVTKKLV